MPSVEGGAVTRVLVTMPFSEAQLDRIRAASPRITVTRDDPARADYRDVEVLYAEKPPADPAQAPDLRWIQLHMAGVNSLQDHPFYRDSDIPLTTTSGVHASTIAEYVIAVLLALAHRVPRMVEWHGRKAWPPDADRWRLFVPTEVRGATIGLIGYGSIGRELARIAVSAFGMTVLACKRNPAERTDRGYGLPGTGDREGRLPAGWFGPAELPRMLPRCDVVVLCAPLTAETRQLIDRAAISAMKPTAYFINVGRGASVDETALAEALAEKRIAGAGIDVFAQEPPAAGHPFYQLDNVIVSPHVSGFLPSYDDRCAELFAENLRRYLAREPLLNLVDRARGY
jgi:phosphoglycerate dehydrogenase-like enzyme